jgi:hypothetical protein
VRGSIACLDCAADKAAGRSARSCLNHDCAAALGGPSEDQRGRLGMRAYCDVLVWPTAITASVKVWPLAPSATCACVPLPAVTMCLVWTAARNAPVFVWGAVRAGSWNTPVGAACGAAREGGRRGPRRAGCALSSHTFIVRARIGQLIRLRRGVGVRFNINKLF